MGGWNCRHSFHPYVHDTARTWTEEQIKALEEKNIEYNGEKYTEYEASQIQRGLERDIRSLKRQIAAIEEVGGDAEAERARLRKANKAYTDFTEKTGLKKQRTRTEVGTGEGKTVDNSAKSGIIKAEKGINMHIDKFTPCLENAQTGEILSTSFSLASKEELKQLSGWKFNWSEPELEKTEIYKLTLANDNEIQGLIALSPFERDKAMYINIVESAPHNLGANKRYNGVGGHLYAIAAQKFVDNGFNGFIFMDAKNRELVEHYEKTLGAILIGRPHPYRMIIDEEAAHKLLKIYTLKED